MYQRYQIEHSQGGTKPQSAERLVTTLRALVPPRAGQHIPTLTSAAVHTLATSGKPASLPIVHFIPSAGAPTEVTLLEVQERLFLRGSKGEESLAVELSRHGRKDEIKVIGVGAVTFAERDQIQVLCLPADDQVEQARKISAVLQRAMNIPAPRVRVLSEHHDAPLACQLAAWFKSPSRHA